MNYYNYLKNQLKNKTVDFRKQKIFKISFHFNWILIILNLSFSSFFVAYFVKLSIFVHQSFYKTVTTQWLTIQRNINNDLLVCLVVFWVIFIVVAIWNIWLFFLFSSSVFGVKNACKKLYLLILVFEFIGLFICFIGLVSNISFFILIKKLTLINSAQAR